MGVVVRGVALVICGGILGCNQTPAPSTLSAATVYGELADANCYSNPDGGVAFVAAEGAWPAAPPWVGCLFEGGTIIGCGVPCDATTVTVTHP